MRIGYIACSPFSGSTLLSFLVNVHPEIASAGHTTGWSGLTPDFGCSCGRNVSACPFFTHVRSAFAAEGIPLAFEGYFPNAYRISRYDRLNQLLFGGLPRLSATRLERARDGLVRRMPGVREWILRVEHSNNVFFSAACSYAGARFYVDNSHSPFRFRQLTYIPSLEVLPVHLIRDPRGVVLSSMETYGWNAEFSARHWIRMQENIVRVIGEAGGVKGSDYDDLVVSYEELCERPVETLNRINDRLGASRLSELGDFKRVEHHILGNRMRFAEGRITRSERWREALTRGQARGVREIVGDFARRSPYRERLEALLERALD